MISTQVRRTWGARAFERLADTVSITARATRGLIRQGSALRLGRGKAKALDMDHNLLTFRDYVWACAELNQ